jgi:xanthine dehydrogenase YagT iron-sulfur-binding subunit
MSDETNKNQALGTEAPEGLGSTSRRSFLSRIGTVGLMITAAPITRAAPQTISEPTPTPPAASPPKTGVPVTLRINGAEHHLQLDPRTTLLDCLRENIGLTGTKKGCDHGQCGACTIHINGRRVNSCLSFAVMHEGDEITTIEGLGQPGNLHPMQSAFVACDGYQCGYCTSGQIMSAVALVNEPCGPDDVDVKELMSGNICRCGAYSNIVAAIQSVRQSERRTVNCEPLVHLANLYLRLPLLTFATNKLIPANQHRQATGRTGTCESVITPSNSKVKAQALAREKSPKERPFSDCWGRISQPTKNEKDRGKMQQNAFPGWFKTRQFGMAHGKGRDGNNGCRTRRNEL